MARASRRSVRAYDAAYVALAEVLEASLLTGDRAVSRVPGVHCPIELVTD